MEAIETNSHLFIGSLHLSGWGQLENDRTHCRFTELLDQKGTEKNSKRWENYTSMHMMDYIEGEK